MKESIIEELKTRYGLDDDCFIPFGYDIAKVDPIVKEGRERKGKLILTTAMTPTKAGEGKTTTAISIADGLNSIGEDALCCLREPSLGPVFGVKGGGTGGGENILVPEEKINLHFTGDFHAMTSANNLIAALIDNALYQHNIDIDPERIMFNRCLDMNDRSLRDVTVLLDNRNDTEVHTSFCITAASELMAIFALAKDEDDFLDRVENILVAYRRDGSEVFVRDLKCRTAIKKLIHDALFPNFVKTKHGTPALVHAGPFANIATGTNSLIATDLGLRLSDYVVTEAGFGSDLGMEKYLDIVSHNGSFAPDIIVMVASIRALKLHGGVKYENLEECNVEAVKTGFANLLKHISNVSLFHIPCIVNINKMKTDHEEELSALESLLSENRIEYALNTSYMDGPEGAVDCAKLVKRTIEENNAEFKPLVNHSMSHMEKIEKISKEIYGADGVVYLNGTDELIKQYQSKYPDFDICMSKVPNSLSDDQHLLNVPKHTIHIKSIRLFTGAKLIVPLTGEIFTMPGLPKVPASEKMENGK